MSLNVERSDASNYAPPFDSDRHRALVEELWGHVKGVGRAREKADRPTEWKHIENGLWRFKSVADISGLERDDRAVVLDLFEDMLHFPVMAGMIQTAVAVFWGMFTAQRPIFEVTARDPSDVLGARLMQLRLDYEVDMRKLMIHLMRLFYDGMTYGFGILDIGYERDERVKTFWRSMQVTNPLTGLPSVSSWREKGPYVAYEGNSFRNVTPYNFGSDWRFPAYEPQRGSFVFHRFVVHYDEMRARKEFKNMDVVKEHVESYARGERPTGADRRQGEDRNLQINPKEDFRVSSADRKSRHMELFRFQRKIIPKDNGLTESTDRETWEVYITDGGVVVGEWPLDNDHGDFTYAGWAPIPYEEVTYPPSIAEMIRPMQDEINWLVNSNRISIRRAINGWWTYDPKFVDVNELKPSRFMKFIKLLRSLPQGVSKEGVLSQIEYADPTKQNLASIGPLIDAMARGSGITDMLQGIPLPSRRTATEAASVTQYAVTRLQVICGTMAIAALSDIARQMVANNQQYAREQTWMRLAGDTYQEVRQELAAQGKALNGEYMRIQPQEIAGNFDFPTFNPQNPSSTPAKIEAMTRFTGELMQTYPVLAQSGYTVDFGLLAQKFGRALNIENLGEIIKKSQTAPSVEQLMGGLGVPGNGGGNPLGAAMGAQGAQ